MKKYKRNVRTFQEQELTVEEVKTSNGQTYIKVTEANGDTHYGRILELKGKSDILNVGSSRCLVPAFWVNKRDDGTLYLSSMGQPVYEKARKDGDIQLFSAKMGSNGYQDTRTAFYGGPAGTVWDVASVMAEHYYGDKFKQSPEKKAEKAGKALKNA